MSIQELGELVHRIAADDTQWSQRVHTPGTNRWWTRLYADTTVDVWLLAWLPGHFTDLHDHGPSGAAFCVVRGQLEEARLIPPGDLQIRRSTPHTPTLIETGVVHDVRAIGSELAVSIHAYSPPLRLMTYYDLDDSGAVHVSKYAETQEPEQELT